MMISRKPRVAVLMSTYNGEKYLEEQIESILAQKGIDVTLYVRDDGSTDSTRKVVARYDCERVKLIAGENQGLAASFMELVYLASGSAEYYSFADQDDVWLPDKLVRAVTAISLYDVPTLYVSNQTLVDSTLKLIGRRYAEAPDYTYLQVLCQNKLSGCTMVWNRKMEELLVDPARRPSRQLLTKRIHDVWVAMVASTVGEVIYDSESRILYRQHDRNVVGVKKTSRLKQWLSKLANPSKRNGRSTLCRELYDKYRDVIPSREVSDRLYMYGYYRESRTLRRKLLRDKSLLAHTGESFMAFRLKVVLGLF